MSDDCGLDHVDGRAYRALDGMYTQLVQREREREARIAALETALRMFGHETELYGWHAEECRWNSTCDSVCSPRCTTARLALTAPVAQKTSACETCGGRKMIACRECGGEGEKVGVTCEGCMGSGNSFCPACTLYVASTGMRATSVSLREGFGSDAR